jgi:hypothetical protein
VPTVSVAVHNNRVYVANAGNRGSNYTGLRLRHDDRLTPVAGSTVALAEGSQPGDVLFNADGTKLAETRIGTSLIDSFMVGDDGRLAAARDRAPERTRSCGAGLAAGRRPRPGSGFPGLLPGRLTSHYPLREE